MLAAAAATGTGTEAVGTARRRGEPPPVVEVGSGLSLARGIWHALRVHPQWGLISVLLFLLAVLGGAFGAVTGWMWGHLVVEPAARRAPDLAAGGPRRVAAPLTAAAGRGDRPLPALVGVGDAARPRHRAHRADAAAPAAAHAAGRGRRPRDGRRPVRPLRRPLGRRDQRPRHRGGHRLRGCQPAERRRALRCDGRLRAGLGARFAGRRALGRRGLRRPGPVRPLAGLGARRRPHREAWPPPPTPCTATSSRSTAAGSTPRCTSTGCRRCWPACRSCSCRSGWWPRGRSTSPAGGAWRPRCWWPTRSTASTGSAGSPAP
nr:hypothetical protein [Angustibacter aerolatus]